MNLPNIRTAVSDHLVPEWLEGESTPQHGVGPLSRGDVVRWTWSPPWGQSWVVWPLTFSLLAALFSDYNCLVASDQSELVFQQGQESRGQSHLGWEASQDLRSPPADHLELGDLSRLTVELFQNSTDFLWMVVPRARFTLQEKWIGIPDFQPAGIGGSGAWLTEPG